MNKPYSFRQLEEAYRATGRQKALDIVPELMLISNRISYGNLSPKQIVCELDRVIRHHMEQYGEKLADSY